MNIYYTDGACSGNPGPGGYGVVEVDEHDNLLSVYQEMSEHTTNNRMELSAILYVMRVSYINHPVVYTDSAYSLNTLTSWMFNWANNGWTKKNGETPENLDLIKEYYDLYNLGYRIELRKIKGHSGNKWNELADALATNSVNMEEINGKK